MTRIPVEWMPLDASDETQFLGATVQGRCLFTVNIRDFIVLAKRFPEHRGIVLAAQKGWTLPQLIESLHRLLSVTQTTDWEGRVHWLNDRRSAAPPQRR